MEFVGYIEKVYDAFILAEAAKRGQIKVMVNRPSFDERLSIHEGMTIIFNETLTGMKRWTDGRAWSPSKLYRGFFVYKEIQGLTKTRRGLADKDPSSVLKENLYKKTISVISPDNNVIHIINYFTQDPKSIKPSPLYKLVTPSHLPLTNMLDISKIAEQYRFFKCFHDKTKQWRKLNPALEQPASISQTATNFATKDNPSADSLGLYTDEAFQYSFLPQTQNDQRTFSLPYSLPCFSDFMNGEWSKLTLNPPRSQFLPRSEEDLRQLSSFSKSL